MNSQKKLIISPHADDEVYGAASMLDNNSIVYVVGIDESRVTVGRPPKCVRMEEAFRASKVSGARYIFGNFLVNYYKDSYCEILDEIEKLINKHHPNIVLVPPMDTNQDHMIVRQVCMTALRPHDKNHFVPVVLEYESPGGTIWTTYSNMVNYFVDLDLDKKMDLYGCYKSQIRSYRSLSLLSDLAVMRGRQSNKTYAEGFKVIRYAETKS
jgi:LmbE family N-acetylglucosaminyl deacetylase